MKNPFKTLIACALLGAAATTIAQTDDNEALKVAALEALIAAPPERALPIVQKVLAGNDSNELKTKALFILSQIDQPEAQTILLDTARNGSGELQLEAIRMIAINGNPEAMGGLADLYASGDGELKEAVLEAYLIADDGDAVYQIALNTQDPEEFERAVEMLGAMGALDQLRTLRERGDMSEELIQAYAIAGDVETLSELANDSSDPETQVAAIRALGIAGDDEVNPTLVGIYRNSDSPDVKEAALGGMLIGDHDEGVLQLFNESNDAEEKRELLELLVMMDSDAVWDIIDATLEGQP